jgi:D-glycero-alpha-D-manno-heptose-7-phosphate kinase
MITASVPVRICDIGGWTDTWFGAPGRVLNIAVRPGVEVTLRPTVARRVVHAPNPIIEAALGMVPPPDNAGVEVAISSVVPAGCGAGTSAAVAVALLGALWALRGESPDARATAYAAHRLEVEVLGAESGIQDQLSTAFGGINFIEIDDYPDAVVKQLPAWAELDAGLTLVFLGRAHDSSSVHRQVIERIRAGGSAAALDALRAAAMSACDSVVARDLHAFGGAMVANADAQCALHPDLVGADAARIFETASASGAIGWKVNGAGGDGGSVTILHDAPDAQQRFAAGLAYEVLPVQIAGAGLTIATS